MMSYQLYTCIYSIAADIIIIVPTLLPTAYIAGNQNITTSSCTCDAIYGFIEQLLIDLDVTEYCCLAEDNITCANNGTRPHAAQGKGV